MVICLELGADHLHVIWPCYHSKNPSTLASLDQFSFFLALAYQICPGKEADVLLTDTARIVCGRITVQCPSICLSLCPICHPLHATAAGLLLWAQRAGDQSTAAATGCHSIWHTAMRHPVANASSVMLSADV